MPAQIRFETQEYEQFVLRYHEWLTARKAEDAVVFCLPRKFSSLAAFPWKISKSDLAAETAFTQYCQSFHAIGVYGRQFINFFDWLKIDQSNTASDLIASPGVSDYCDSVTNGGAKQAMVAAEMIDSLHRRMLGAAGWLICNPEFNRERDEIRRLWERLPEKYRTAATFGPIRQWPIWLMSDAS